MGDPDKALHVRQEGSTIGSGELVALGPHQQELKEKITEAISLARQGKFVPVREKDEITVALGTKEHPGRMRGVGSVPWKEGFPDDTHMYRARSRRPTREEEAGRMRLEVAYQVKAQHAVLFPDGVLGRQGQVGDQLVSPGGKRSSCASADNPPPEQHTTHYVVFLGEHMLRCGRHNNTYSVRAPCPSSEQHYSGDCTQCGTSNMCRANNTWCSIACRPLKG